MIYVVKGCGEPPNFGACIEDVLIIPTPTNYSFQGTLPYMVIEVLDPQPLGLPTDQGMSYNLSLTPC